MSNIKGIGNDIIEIARIENAIKKHGNAILNKIFTQREKNYCLKYGLPYQRFAGRFAAKEAILKALGYGISKNISWHDIEILNDENGKPYVILSEEVKKIFSNPDLFISISHCINYAAAFAIATD